MSERGWIVLVCYPDKAYAAFSPFATQQEAEAYKATAYNPDGNPMIVLLTNRP